MLVEVGPGAIRLGEFQRAFGEILTQRDSGYGPDSASARRFLRTYIDKTLVEQMAADSIPWTPLLEHRARNLLENVMMQRLRQDRYGAYLYPSERDLRAIYDKGHTRYRFRAAPYRTAAEAEAAVRAVREGAVFERVAGQAAGGGEQGWQSVFTAPEAVIDALEKLQPNQVGGPVRVPGRFWVVQLLERAPNAERPEFDRVRNELARKFQIERGGIAIEDYHARLLSDYQYRTYMPEVLWLTRLLREATVHIPRRFIRADDDGPSRDPVPWPDCPIPQEDWSRAIASSSADTVSAILVLDDLMSKLQHTWPTFETPDDVLVLARDLMIDRIERAETWARGYDKDPDLQWEAKKRRGQIHTRQFYTRVVASRSRPTVEEARVWYEEHADEFREPARRRCLQVLVATWDEGLVAQRLLRETRDPARATAAARSALPGAQVSLPAGLTVTEGQVGGVLERQLFRHRDGEVTDPLPLGAGFVVLRVEEAWDGRTPPFEEVSTAVMERLGEQAADALFKVLLAQRREATRIVVHEQAWRRLEIRPPAAAAPAGGAAPAAGGGS